jgi:hypothetical protein
MSCFIYHSGIQTQLMTVTTETKEIKRHKWRRVSDSLRLADREDNIQGLSNSRQCRPLHKSTSVRHSLTGACADQPRVVCLCRRVTTRE